MYFEMTPEHLAIISKDRTGLFGNNPPFVPTKQTGEIIRQWLESGIERPKQIDQHEMAYIAIETELNQFLNSTPSKEELFKWY